MNHDPLDVIARRWREPGLIPGFDLINVLGSGGQGLVIKAVKTAIGRTYAVKFLRPPDDVNPTTWRCAELDHIDALANLRHPHLVSIEDRGEALTIPFIVLEYAGDQTLKSRVTNRSLTFQQAVAWVDQTASAVQYLHDHGVLHLDVKPSNVYVHDGRAKLGDFGLVRLATQTGAVDLSLALGTPEYVAPEIVSLHRASPASDVFGLGRTLDDCLIAAAVKEDQQPVDGLVELATEASALDPDRRPSLLEFRQRLRTPKGLRPIKFRQVRTAPAPSGPRSPRFRDMG